MVTLENKISADALRRLAFELLTTAGADEAESRIVAEVLMWGTLTERETQGVWRLPVYLERFQKGGIASPCRPQWHPHTDTVHVLDGAHGFGPYVAHLAMARATDLAEKFGVGVVAVRNSNHFGAAAYYPQMAAARGQIGFACTNAGRRVAPFGATGAVLGTNPLAFAAPMRGGDSILVDLSTSASSGSAVRKASEENRAVSREVSIDPSRATEAALLPFGAKGFALGLMVEILSGVVSGSAISAEIPPVNKEFEKKARVGHHFAALDISRFIPLETYFDRIDTLAKEIKNAPRAEGVSEVLLPGESRWRALRRNRAEGVALDESAARKLAGWAERLKVKLPW